jgi:hypothetical protein
MYNVIQFILFLFIYFLFIVIVSLGGRQWRSATKPESLNPQWFSNGFINISLPVPLNLAPFIQVSLFDNDDMKIDETIGRFFISTSDVICNREQVNTIKPVWYNCCDWANKPCK